MEKHDETAVHILLNKRPGQEEFESEISADKPSSLIHGVTMVIIKSAQALNIGIEHMMAMLATVLFAPEDGQQAEG